MERSGLCNTKEGFSLGLDIVLVKERGERRVFMSQASLGSLVSRNGLNW